MTQRMRDMVIVLATLCVVWLTDHAAFVLATTVVGVDTTTTQTLSNKTMDDTNLYGLISYGGKLRIRDVQAQSANFNVDTHREHIVTTGGGGDIIATLPAATGSFYTYDVCKVDTGASHVVITRAGSDVIISKSAGSANTRTLASLGDCDTLQDAVSGKWIARGDAS